MKRCVPPNSIGMKTEVEEVCTLNDHILERVRKQRRSDRRSNYIRSNLGERPFSGMVACRVVVLSTVLAATPGSGAVKESAAMNMNVGSTHGTPCRVHTRFP